MYRAFFSLILINQERALSYINLYIGRKYIYLLDLSKSNACKLKIKALILFFS